MTDRVLILDNEAAMGRMLAKALERDQARDERVVEIRLKEHDRFPNLDWSLKMNRKERRSFGSPKKHMKGLR